jgi:hypothetical protein
MNIRRAMAEQILAGNSTEPAIEVFLRDIDEFLRERGRLRRSGVSIPPRQRFVRCSFPDAPWSWMKFYVGSYRPFIYTNHYQSASELAYCCRGDVRAVKRIHAAILRARDRCRRLCPEGVP